MQIDINTKYEELKKYVSLVDEQFKTELASRQKKYVPNRYIVRTPTGTNIKAPRARAPVPNNSTTTVFPIRTTISRKPAVKYPPNHSQVAAITVVPRVTGSVTAERHLKHKKPSGLENLMSAKTLSGSSPRIINPDGAGQCRLTL